MSKNNVESFKFKETHIISLIHEGNVDTYCGKWVIHRDDVSVGTITIGNRPTPIGLNEVGINIDRDCQNEGIGGAALTYLYQNIVSKFIGKEYQYNNSLFGIEMVTTTFKGIVANVGFDLKGSIITQLKAGAVLYNCEANGEGFNFTNLEFAYPPLTFTDYEPQISKKIFNNVKSLFERVLKGGTDREKAFLDYDNLVFDLSADNIAEDLPVNSTLNEENISDLQLTGEIEHPL